MNLQRQRSFSILTVQDQNVTIILDWHDTRFEITFWHAGHNKNRQSDTVKTERRTHTVQTDRQTELKQKDRQS